MWVGDLVRKTYWDRSCRLAWGHHMAEASLCPRAGCRARRRRRSTGSHIVLAHQRRPRVQRFAKFGRLCRQHRLEVGAQRNHQPPRSVGSTVARVGASPGSVRFRAALISISIPAQLAWWRDHLLRPAGAPAEDDPARLPSLDRPRKRRCICRWPTS